MKVVCFGEALVDMLSNRVSGASVATEHEQFTKFAGGAPANAAVAVAKLGGNAYFAGMLGEDAFGRFLQGALDAEGVKTDYVRFTPESKTALAFVSLDENGERSFEFYRPPAADLLFRAGHFDPDTFAGNGILHICSNSLTEEGIADTTATAVALAREAGWLVSFDVNLRHNLWPTGYADRQRINQLVAKSDIVKLSLEELEYLAAEENPETGGYISRQLQQRPQLILVTDGGHPVQWATRSDWGGVRPPAVNAVDTTAGGDGFIGGFIYQLAADNVSAGSLMQWLESGAHEKALAFACACGAHAVSRRGAFVALPTQKSLQDFLNAGAAAPGNQLPND
ncbi:carbohydrate kinase [Microbulbifer sp. YPW1]|uniref:carbohydrate kinase family protein n=1 Tax=Microbulbifer sp. YPW1 TaxID=2745199 RepID=UPI001C6342C3|nr:carbohydrate kinase [Microbulbifer sp. YPW1]